MIILLFGVRKRNVSSFWMMLIFLTPLANNYFLEIINYYCMSFCFLNKYINVFCFKLWCLIIYTGKYFFFFFFGSIIGMFPHEAPFLGYLPEDLYSVGCIASTDLETFINIKNWLTCFISETCSKRANWTCYVKHDRLAVMLNALRKITYPSVIKLTLKQD